MMQSGFFDLSQRYQKLSELGDPLEATEAVVNWERFRPTLNKVLEKERKSNAGRKPFDPVLMFKVLVLQGLYNLADDQTEFQIRDRFSFLRFLGLTPEGKAPDAKTMGVPGVPEGTGTDRRAVRRVRPRSERPRLPCAERDGDRRAHCRGPQATQYPGRK